MVRNEPPSFALVCLGAGNCSTPGVPSRWQPDSWLSALPAAEPQPECCTSTSRGARRNETAPLLRKPWWPPPELPTSLPAEALDFRHGQAWHGKPQRTHWVPPLLQVAAAASLPCGAPGGRNEEAVLVQSLFAGRGGHARRRGGEARPGADDAGGGVFLEIGAFDGLLESSTLSLERCLGWRGVLVEGQPSSFANVRRHRPATLNLRLASCTAPGWVNFTRKVTTMARAPRDAADAMDAAFLLGRTPVLVQCGPLGDYLEMLGVTTIDLFSIECAACARRPHSTLP